MRSSLSIRPARVRKVLYQQTAGDDIVCQFRFYLFTTDAPEIAVGFRGSMRAVNQAYHSPLIVASNPIGTKQCACRDTHK